MDCTTQIIEALIAGVIAGAIICYTLSKTGVICWCTASKPVTVPPKMVVSSDFTKTVVPPFNDYLNCYRNYPPSPVESQPLIQGVRFKKGALMSLIGGVSDNGGVMFYFGSAAYAPEHFGNANNADELCTRTNADNNRPNCLVGVAYDVYVDPITRASGLTRKGNMVMNDVPPCPNNCVGTM